MALEALNPLGPNSVIVFSRHLPEKRACQELGKVLTAMVLGNRLMFGSVSSNKSHFETSLKDLLSMMITRKLYLTDFQQAFKSEKENVKTVIYFK